MLKISKTHLLETISILKASKKKERLVLWFGKENPDGYIVNEIFEPLQFTQPGYFEVPPEGISQLFEKVKTSRNFIVAQIHTHPKQAFHSLIDDEMAIPRHKGALSLVLPKYASEISIYNFHNNVAVFELNDRNCWIEVSSLNIYVYE